MMKHCCRFWFHFALVYSCCLLLPDTARNDTVEYYPCLTWFSLVKVKAWPRPKRNPQIIRSILLTITLCLVHLKPFLFIFAPFFFLPFTPISPFSRATTHTSLYCQFLFSFMVEDDSHCYPFPGLISISFYAPCNEFPFHRFQSLIVYCIIIMHVWRCKGSWFGGICERRKRASS